YVFYFNYTSTTAIYTLSLHDALPIFERIVVLGGSQRDLLVEVYLPSVLSWVFSSLRVAVGFAFTGAIVGEFVGASSGLGYLMNLDRKSTRLNSSHDQISYAVFCLKKK